MSTSADRAAPDLMQLEERHERRFRIALNAMPVPLSYARLDDGVILFMNRKFTKTYGYRLGDIETVQEWVEQAYPRPEQRARAEQAWFVFFRNPTEDEFEIDPVEVDIRCKDGSIKTALHGGVILPEPRWALATFVDITARKQNEALIRQLAEEDALTGLANRRVFEAQLELRLADAVRDGSVLRVLMLDLDHFKDVNDRLGHETGDALLREVGRRLRSCLRRSDTVARLGGDEFAMILPKAGSTADVDRLCAKIVELVSHTTVLDGQPAGVGVSIGVATFPTDANDPRGLLRAADQALYKVKATGRGTWQYASPTTAADASTTLSV